MFSSIISRRTEEEEEEEEEAIGEELEVENGRRCGKGHTWRVVVETSQGGIICLACFSALLSDLSSPSHHVSYALSQISSFLESSNSLVLLHHHDAQTLLVPSLVRALFCDSFTRDETLAQHLVHLISSLSHQHHAGDSEAVAAAFSGHFIMQITDQLSSSTTITTWNPRHIYALHCLGILLDSQRDGDPTSHIRGKTSLFSNLVAGLRLPSDEIRGEVLFVLFKLSDIHATPWEDANCDNNDGDDSSFTGLKLQLLRLSLEALLKTQHDDVRINCLDRQQCRNLSQELLHAS